MTSLSARLSARNGKARVVSELEARAKTRESDDPVFSTQELKEPKGSVGVSSVVKNAYNPMNSSRSSNRTRFYTFGGETRSDQQKRTFGAKRG